MITQKSYQSLFQKVYYIILALCLIAYLYEAYHDGYSHRADGEPPFLFQEVRSFIFLSFGLFFFFPALTTWVIMGIVRLTNKVEPDPEQQAGKSLVERQTKLQLFGIIGFALLLPFIACRALDIHLGIYYQPRWLIYLGVISHGLFSFAVVLLLRGISKCGKMGWKIVITALMIFAMFIYLVVLYAVFSTDRESEYAVADEFYEYDDDPNADFANEDPESLAYQEVRDALGLFDSSNSFLTTAANFIPFDPDYFHNYIPSAVVPEGASDAEIDQLYAQSRQRDSITYRLSRFYDWVFVRMDSESFQPMIDKIKAVLLRDGGAIDYKQYAQRIDMLDLAYHDLNASIDEENNFYRIYEYATEHPLKWDLYAAEFITDPYIRSTVEGDDQAKDLLLWAYTFWGRRHNEGTIWNWRYALDQLLEVHPNTHYPAQELHNQRESMRNAEQRAVAFLKWYKANYWSFQEMPIAGYNEGGSLVKFDLEQATKYLYALEKSGYLSAKLIQKVRTKFEETEAASGVKTGKVNSGEWLRTDPLVPDYNSVARELDQAECRTEYIRQMGKDMQLSLTGGLTLDMECVNGEWVIYQFEAPTQNSR